MDDQQALSDWFQEAMISIYGRKPWQASGFADAADIWAESLAKRGLFTQIILQQAVAYCVDNVPTIPTLPQFVEICRAVAKQLELLKPKPTVEPRQFDPNSPNYLEFKAAVRKLSERMDLSQKLKS
jgi:hypothetical protein